MKQHYVPPSSRNEWMKMCVYTGMKVCLSPLMIRELLSFIRCIEYKAIGICYYFGFKTRRIPGRLRARRSERMHVQQQLDTLKFGGCMQIFYMTLTGGRPMC